MKYAVVSQGAKQYIVSEGEVIEIEALPLNVHDTYTFPQVIVYVDESQRKIGTPVLSDVMVTASIISNIKGKKIRVSKFKAKSRYRRVKGFRPLLTKVKIETISIKKKD